MHSFEESYAIMRKWDIIHLDSCFVSTYQFTCYKAKDILSTIEESIVSEHHQCHLIIDFVRVVSVSKCGS